MRLVILLFFVVTLGAAPVYAAPSLKDPGPNRMVPEQSKPPQIGNRQAASRVKQVYSDHKILAVQLIETRGPPVYRVKTLSDEGVVKFVFVDGTSGNVFE